jgi:hypothetical protein
MHCYYLRFVRICFQSALICLFDLNADGGEETGFADLGQNSFTNPVGELFGFGFI